MPVVCQAKMVVQVEQLCVEHPLVVVHSLITPVILGIAFLQQHGLVLDFVSVSHSALSNPTVAVSYRTLGWPIVQEVRKDKATICALYGAIESTSEPTEEEVDDCTIPRFKAARVAIYLLVHETFLND